MTKEEAASGLIAISRWLEIQGLLGEKAKSVLILLLPICLGTQKISFILKIHIQ